MRNRLTRGVLCPAVLAAVFACAACDVKVGDGGMSFDVTQGRAEDEWTRTYTLAKGSHLEIVSGGGPVNVTPSAGETVEIRIIREGRAATDEAAQQALKEETITEEVTPDRVKVQTTRSARENSAPLGRRRISTEYRVSLPPGLNVAIRAENADVSLNEVQGQFTLENTNGGFRARGLSGSITATTVNGIIDVDMMQLAGDVTATTVNGPVRIGLPDDINATLEARSVNGIVTVDPDLPFTPTERERARLSGRFGKGGPAVILNTTNGPVSIAQAGRGRRGGGPRGGEPVVLERELQER
jgi:DUF4097 and DUF4098 domain-containing protein YvlB